MTLGMFVACLISVLGGFIFGYCVGLRKGYRYASGDLKMFSERWADWKARDFKGKF